MSFPLSLRALPSKDASTESLGAILKRINQERGHFRNITEDSLREEIAAGEGDAVDKEAADEAETSQDLEQRRKALYSAREEMLKYVRQAQNEALTALDFMSLLISRDAPRQADLSMSPFLKQAVPGGTLGFDNTQASRPSQEQDAAAKTTSIGWNFQSLNGAADRLLDSATRLGAEMEKEARYWKDILSVSEKGWSLCRLPREKHTVAVRFGFSEAASLFNSQGLAALRPDGDGNITFDQGLATDPRYMRVRLMKNGKVMGVSSLPASVNINQAPLEALIHRARDSLFEKELFHEMTREARSHLAYGVNVVSNQIHIPARQQALEDGAYLRTPYDIIIDQVSQTETAERLEDPESTQLANVIASSLRVLLTNVYRRRFRLRSKAPPPLSDDKRIIPVESIIRPMMCHFEHNTAVHNLKHLSTSLIQCLRAAGLQAKFTLESSWLTGIMSEDDIQTYMEALVASLDSPLKTRLRLELPQTRPSIVDISTHLSYPYFGTLFEVNIINDNEHQQQTLKIQFRQFSDLYQHVTTVACSAVARHLAKYDPTWVLDDAGTSLRKVFHGVKQVKHVTVAYQNGRLAILTGDPNEPIQVLGLWHSEGGMTGEPITAVLDKRNSEE